MTKRAIVYARVSTDEQAENGFSLVAQVEAGGKYAETLGFTVAFELKDEGVSGAIAFSERPASAKAWALLHDGKAEALIVQNVDRLSRDVVDLLVTIRALLRAGVEVHCLDLGRVTSEYDIMLVIRGWQGSDERQKIKERFMRGKREKLKQGMVIAGHLPYGYVHLRNEKGQVVNLAVNEDQAAVVRLIFEWYTVGDDSGKLLSIRGIAMRLKESGIPTAKAGSDSWATTIVRRILRNPTYKGEWHYNAGADAGTQEQTFVIAVPAIVDAATWEKVQVQLERNKLKAKRNGKHDYLLTGIIKCGCGRSMHGHYIQSGQDKSFFYYVCSDAAMRKDERQCNEKYIRADHLDAATWLALRDRLEHSDTLKADMLEAQRREDEEREPKTAELGAVLAMMREAEGDAVTLAKTLNSLTDEQRKGIVGRSLQNDVDAVNARYDQLTARRDKLEAELANRRVTAEAIAQTIAYTEGARVGLDHATNEDKRFMLDTFNARVTVTDGKPVLSLWMPDEVLIELQLHTRRSRATRCAPARTASP